MYAYKPDQDVMKKINEQNRKINRSLSSRLFSRARREAERAGLLLVKLSDDHYMLFGPKESWMHHIYPSNCRIVADKNKPKRPPFLPGLTKKQWTIETVVHRAVQVVKKKSAKRS